MPGLSDVKNLFSSVEYCVEVNNLDATKDIGAYQCTAKDSLNRSGTAQLYLDRIIGKLLFFIKA